MDNMYGFLEEDNNNVDENSNDHQYNDYANIHQLNDQMDYRYLPNWPNNPRVDREQAAVRERVYQRINGNSEANNDPVDRVEFQRNSHRRNVSEDLSSMNIGNVGSNSCRRQDNQQSPDDIRREAEELFCNFTVEQFRSQNIDTSHLGSSVRPYFTNPHWAKAGQDLRMLADAFSKSPEREVLRRKADNVNMSSITMDNFFLLCSELFQGTEGINQDRIVVLFTFISDVAIRHVRIRAQQFIQTLMSWSLRFIFDRICAWVQEAGGWSAVLNTGANVLFKVSLTLLVSLGIVALGVYIVKTVKEL